jgi:hypothetical protein
MLKRTQWIITALTSSLIFFSSPLFAEAEEGFFSKENVASLKQNPATLFSAINTCRIRTVLGNTDFDIFSHSMDEMTIQPDEPGYLSIAGFGHDQRGSKEAFFRMSINATEKVWVAFLDHKNIRYLTNDKTSYLTPPKVILDWAKQFKEAKWTYNLIDPQPVVCDKMEGKMAEPTTQTKVIK